MLPYPRNVQEIHSQKLHFEHTSKEKPRNPKSTRLEYDLSQWYREMNKTLARTMNNDVAQESVLPLEIMNPPRAITTSIAKDPKVFETIIFLPKDPITRNRPIDIWCRKKYSKNCRKNLQIKGSRLQSHSNSTTINHAHKQGMHIIYLAASGSYPIT